MTVEKYLREVCCAEPTTNDWKCMYPLTIATQFGPLLLDVQDSQIDDGEINVYGRFLNTDKACEALNPDKRLGAGLNPFSGKWNHYLGPESRALDTLKHYMARVPLVIDYQI